MRKALRHRSVRDFSDMSADDARQLLDAARETEALGKSGCVALRGKNLAILFDAPAHTGRLLFEQAATELGAQVAQLRTGLNESSTPAEVEETARLLGRLYDAVDCVGMSAELVARMGRLAGVPVFEGLSSPGHPLARLAGVNSEKRHRALVQALLIGVLRG